MKKKIKDTKAHKTNYKTNNKKNISYPEIFIINHYSEVIDILYKIKMNLFIRIQGKIWKHLKKQQFSTIVSFDFLFRQYS